MKKLSVFIVTFLIAALLPFTAVRAAELENVVLTAQEGKAKIKLRLPDAAEGVSTLRIRIKVEGDTEKLDQNQPFTLKADKEISSSLLETRFQMEEGYFTIYLSDTSHITEKTDFELGTIIPNSIDDSEYELTISVPETGLEYVDGTGILKDEVSVVSSAVALKVNESESTPDTDETPDTDDTPDTGDTPDTDETPDTDDTTDTDNTPDSDNTPDVDDTTDSDAASGNGSDDESKSEGGTSDSENGNKDTSDSSKNENGEERTVDEQKKAVQTGDQSSVMIYLVLAGISIAGIGTVIILRRK